MPFAGWELPVQYSGIIAEHQAVRSKAGLFDVSHMGEIIFSGPESEAALEYMTCNKVSSLEDGKAHYSAILNDSGGVVDDIIVYRFSKDRYLVCVNAANSDKDFEWFASHNKFNAKIENKSAAYGQIALQGPQAQAILQKLNGASSACELKYFCFCEAELGGCQAIIARTGYTGEDGFEFFMPWDGAPAVWNLLLEQGEGLGLLPCGLGARDSLRLEACYPLHGHELSDEISALESGLGWIVKFDKGDFIGKQALQRQKDSGLKRNLIGFYVDDPGIARHGDKVYAEDGASEIGVVTSGTKTPTLSRALGMALVDAAHSKVDSKIAVDVRGRKLSCSVVKKPFYKRG